MNAWVDRNFTRLYLVGCTIATFVAVMYNKMPYEAWAMVIGIGTGGYVYKRVQEKKLSGDMDYTGAKIQKK